MKRPPLQVALVFLEHSRYSMNEFIRRPSYVILIFNPSNPLWLPLEKHAALLNSIPMKRVLVLSSLFAFSCLAPNLVQAEVDYVKEILPIFEKHCMSCHREAYKDPKRGRTKKPKSGYRMDSAEFIKGEGYENDVNIVDGDPEKSPVYTYMLLPEDHDWAMPTKGDRVPKEDIDKVGAWIKAGAKFGDWKVTKFTPAGEKVE